MNEITPLAEWLDTTTHALQALDLQVEYDKAGSGHYHGRLLVTRKGMLLHHKYEIKFLSETTDSSGYGQRRFYAQLMNPKVKRTVRIKIFTPENVAIMANYAASSLDSWQATDHKAKVKTSRKAVADELARTMEIDSSHVPAWAVVSPNIEENQDASTFRLSFRAYDIGYPLKALSPAQVKRVLHFIKRLDNADAPVPAPGFTKYFDGMHGVLSCSRKDAQTVWDAAQAAVPACTCDCLPCQSCDHR